MKVVIDYVTTMVPAEIKGASIAKRIGREMINDMDNIPPVICEFYMKQLSALIYWTATGETMEGISLPEDFLKVD